METFSWRDLRYLMSKKWKSLAGELYDISCPRSVKVCLENSAKSLFYKVEKVLLEDTSKFHVHDLKKIKEIHGSEV